MSEEVTVEVSEFDSLVRAYMNIRLEREKLQEQYEQQDTELAKDQKVIEFELLNRCNEMNASSIKTKSGTVVRRLNERFYCNDWDNFRKFIIENQAVELLERRIHQSNFKEFITDRLEKDGLPPGVNVMREYGIVVRKPSK